MTATQTLRIRVIRRTIVAVASLLGCSGAAAFEMEMGTVTVQDTFTTPAWTSVTFIRPFQSTPLVFALPTTDGSDPSTLRIRNITAAGFQVVQTEPFANDGLHLAMPTAYLAIEPGAHQLPDGTRIAAIAHTTSSFANSLISTTWDTVSFPAPFLAAPAVLGSIQTTNSESGTPPSTSSTPFMDVGIQAVSLSSLQVTLERAESTAGTVVAETIALLAIEAGANVNFVDGFGVAVQLQSLRTPTNIRGFSNGCFSNSYTVPFGATPLAVASANTRSGNNGGWVRRCSQSAGAIGLTIDEDADNDSERSHTSEAAGVVAASVAFHANFEVDLAVAASVSAISDPVNGTTNQKSIPEAVVGYTIDIENRGSLSPDDDSIIITEDIPPELELCVTAGCFAGGPVILDTSGSPVPPGVTIGGIEYSDDGGLTYSYTPVPGPDGFDPAVDSIRILFDGTLRSMDIAGAPSFEVRLAARIN